MLHASYEDWNFDTTFTLGDFDWGRPAPGAWVTWEADDPKRQRRWDPAVARVVRDYTR